MRNKKFLALAMAAVVGMTSAPAVYNNVVVAEAAVGDATVKNVSITGGYGTANSGDEAMTGDFELVYTFTNKTQDASTNWFNYGVEVHNGVGGFISTRADNYGWLANDWNTDGSVMSWGDGAESWDDFREVMKDASVKVTVREGNTVTVANDITGNADSSKKYNFVCTCAMANLPEKVYVHLTGEKVDLSDIKAELKAEAEPTVAPTEVPGRACYFTSNFYSTCSYRRTNNSSNRGTIRRAYSSTNTGTNNRAYSSTDNRAYRNTGTYKETKC